MNTADTTTAPEFSIDYGLVTHGYLQHGSLACWAGREYAAFLFAEREGWTVGERKTARGVHTFALSKWTRPDVRFWVRVSGDAYTAFDAAGTLVAHATFPMPSRAEDCAAVMRERAAWLRRFA